MENILLSVLIVIILTIFFISMYFLDSNTTKKCNSNYNSLDDHFNTKLNYPEYKVHAINEVCCSNKGIDISEYVLWNFYLKDKNKVGHQELIIYDEIGKYNIGDILIFTKLEK